MIILALDTCCSRCSVAIFKEQSCIQYLIEETPHKQAEVAVPMIEKALTQAGLDHKDIDYIAATIGPGSFTGIRIGISALQGINQVLKKPTVGISTLETMTFLTDEKEVVTTLGAGRGQFYCQRFSNFVPISDIQLLTENQAKEFIAETKVIGALGASELPDARLLAMAALRRINAHHFTSMPLEPLYVREPDAVEKIKKTLENT